VTEAVLADGALARDDRVRTAYTSVADTYGDRFVAELDEKPFDAWLLERLAGLAEGGPVADAGCGPGHISFHLAAAGADVTGFDLTPAMVAEARRRFPELRFEEGDLTALPPPEGGGGWAVALAWYSLVHMASSELAPALAFLTAAVRPGGWVAVGLHAGAELVHVEDWLDHPVDLDFAFHDPEVVLGAFTTAGLTEVEWYRRGPYTASAETTNRLYVLGRRPT
jgi:SAM-dependent methyltransferase